MAKRVAKTGLQDWLKGRTKNNPGVKAAWERWPQAARDEIAEVLRLCDAGEVAVSTTAMIARLRDAYGVDAGRAQLDVYCRRALRRRSWALP
jgi:hypothetical protein